MSELSLAGADNPVEVNVGLFQHPKYQLVRKVATGAEGVVWEATNHLNGNALVLKFYKTKEKWEHEKMIIKEIRLRCSNNPIMMDKFCQLTQVYFN